MPKVHAQFWSPARGQGSRLGRQEAEKSKACRARGPQSERGETGQGGGVKQGLELGSQVEQSGLRLRGSQPDKRGQSQEERNPNKGEETLEGLK